MKKLVILRVFIILGVVAAAVLGRMAGSRLAPALAIYALIGLSMFIMWKAARRGK